MRYVRATGHYTINHYDRPRGDQSLTVRAGDLVPADHWAVLSCSEPSWFVETTDFPRKDNTMHASQIQAALEDIARRRTDIEADLAGLDETRSPGARERATNLRSGLASLDREETRLQQKQSLLDTYTRSGGQGRAFEHGSVVAPATPAATSTRTGPGAEALGTLSRAKHLGDELADRLAALVERDATPATASWITAGADPNYASAFAKLARDPHNGQREWTTEELHAYQRAKTLSRALNLTTGAELVPSHLDPTVMLSSDGSTDPMRDIARRVTITTSEWNGVSSEGITSEWLAEEAEVDDHSPEFTDPNIPVHKASSFVPISFEALGDMANVASEMRRLFTDAKLQHEAPAFIHGTGSGQPTGLLTSLGAGQTVETADTGTFDSADVYALLEALPPRFRTNARWLASLPIVNTLDQLETPNGAKKFPGVGTAEPVLLRRRLHEHSELPDDIAAGEHVLIVGDFRYYVLVDRTPFAVELIPNLFGANRRPTGQRGWFAHWRVGGDVVVPNAFRRLEVAA